MQHRYDLILTFGSENHQFRSKESRGICCLEYKKKITACSLWRSLFGGKVTESGEEGQGLNQTVR